MKKLLTATLLSLTLLAPAAQAFISVAPAIVEMQARTGKKYKGTLKVTNTKDHDVTVIIEVQEWWKAQTGLEGSQPGLWLTIPKKPFALKPGESRDVRYKVKIPKGVSGEAAAMVFFSINDRSGPSAPMNIQMRHGIPIYVFIKDTQKIEASLKPLSAFFVQQSSNTALQFTIPIANTGNVHIRPQGTISITASPDNEAVSGDLEWGWPVYPGREHSFYATIRKEQWLPGTYSADLQVQDGGVISNDLSLKKTIVFRVTEENNVEIIE